MKREIGYPYNDRQGRVYKNIAERGVIYKFIEAEGKNQPKGHYCLVVSSMARATDKIITILTLGNSPAGIDVIPVTLPDGTQMYLHCGMVTYTGRDRLGDIVMALSDEEMDKVNTCLMNSLGLSDTADYKTLYENLMDRVCDKLEG